MKIRHYKDYDEYKKAQIQANAFKLKHVWVVEEEVRMIADYMRQHLPNATFGICHGTRNGAEIRWFRELLGIQVIGTDIAPTATHFPHTIEWDFHKVKDEWIDHVDFIYSNALDHSYDPRMCLDQWMKCVKKEGLCFIEWTKRHRPGLFSKWDPFGASKEEYAGIIQEKYVIKDVLTCRAKQCGRRTWRERIRPLWKVDRHVFVIQHGRIE